MVWNDRNQLNGVHHVTSSNGPSLSSSQPTSKFSTTESTTKGHNTVYSNEIKLGASTWPSPPIFYMVTQDASTQTDDAETLVSSQQDNDKKNNKQSFLKTITVKRSASFGDHRKERLPKNDDKSSSLSSSSSSLKKEEITSDYLSGQKPKRTKSLKLTV